MNEKLKEKKIEISVKDLIAFRDVLAKFDEKNRDSVDITKLSIYDYDRALADATYQDYSNYWIKATTSFFAMCLKAGVPDVAFEDTDLGIKLDLESLL